MRYISDKVISAGVFRNRDGEPIAASIVKPSDLLGSLKRSLGRKSRCQCKHHQQKLLAKQEEQREKLKQQLIQSGDHRHLAALTRHAVKYSSTRYVLPIQPDQHFTLTNLPFQQAVRSSTTLTAWTVDCHPTPTSADEASSTTTRSSPRTPTATLIQVYHCRRAHRRQSQPPLEPLPKVQEPRTSAIAS